MPFRLDGALDYDPAVAEAAGFLLTIDVKTGSNPLELVDTAELVVRVPAGFWTDDSLPRRFSSQSRELLVRLGAVDGLSSGEVCDLELVPLDELPPGVPQVILR